MTAHLQNALLTTADLAVDRALLGRLLRRVALPLGTERSCKGREGDRMLPAPGTRHAHDVPPREGSLTWRTVTPSAQAADCLRRRGRHCAVRRCGGCSHCGQGES